MNEKMLTRKEAAEFLGVQKATLDAWAHDGRYQLPFYKVGRCCRYKVKDLEVFLENSKRGA